MHKVPNERTSRPADLDNDQQDAAQALRDSVEAEETGK
jgi:hypothetical protein